jgi:small subunit ribosomal protein S6
MRRYEQIYILRPSLSEDEINTVIENTNQVITDEEGSIISIVKWGMKKLAYPIKKELQGYYVFSDFAATPAAVAEVERKFRIDDSVLKYLSIKLSDSISAEEIEAAQNEAAAKAVSLEQETDEADAESTESAGKPETVAVESTESADKPEKAVAESTESADEPEKVVVETASDSEEPKE